jgi:dTDP-4-amino-4,6-dideoxygalactose transaminase
MFSFDPVKAITCIDGGILVVQSEELKKKLHAMRLIGMTQPVSQMYANSRAWTYDIEGLGFRYHMANLHAAIGLAQIKKISEIRATRQAVCETYRRELSGLDWLEAPGKNFDEVNPFLYYIRVKGGLRDQLRTHLKSRGVDTGIHWQAGHGFSFFQSCRRGSLATTEIVVNEILSLPLHSKMESESLQTVIRSIRTFEK